ncbi:MAG TPA: ornithine cyclodeaminase family protein [Puia sp.]|nr:ornithine cyclodeaminase family protein [Puia sp.]
MLPPTYLDRRQIADLLPMHECISVMERMFLALARGECLQPLRSLLWLPDHSGLLGMMPGYSAAGSSGPDGQPASAREAGILGIKVLTIFHGNGAKGLPSHQGVVMLFDANTGTPLLLLDAAEITAIRTAAASAVATRLLARREASHLAILGTGEQAEKHIEAISLVQNVSRITLWGRNRSHAEDLALRLEARYNIPFHIADSAQQAAANAHILCTVTASPTPVLEGAWIPAGAHINAVGSCTPSTRELDTAAVVRSRLFTDRYESLFREAGEFLIPRSEGLLTESDVRGEIGEVLTGLKPGRLDANEITVFKSLGIAMEDLFAARHIYDKFIA